MYDVKLWWVKGIVYCVVWFFVDYIDELECKDVLLGDIYVVLLGGCYD